MEINRAAVKRAHRRQESPGQSRRPIVVLVDNLDKASNLGGVIRTADAFRCEGVVTNRSEADLAGAMGAEYWQPVSWNTEIIRAARRLRRGGYRLVALEQDERGVPIDGFHFPEKVALAIGAEVFGVSADMLELADDIVYIPQDGQVKSLNVAAATAIALYEYGRQHWMPGFSQPGRNLRPAAESFRLPAKSLRGLARNNRD